MGSSANNLDFPCQWTAGFNLDASFKGTLGYLLHWNGGGGLNLKKDIVVWSPVLDSNSGLVSGERMTCIALIEAFKFDGGKNDPIRVSGFVSKDNAAEIRARLARPLTSTKLQFSWYITDYDNDRKSWYDASFVRGKKKAESVIDSTDGELQIFINKQPQRISETLDINVYKFEFQAVPAEGKKSTLEFATGPSQRLVKSWAG